MTEGMAPYYASLRLREADDLRRIRDEVWERLDPPGCYERSEPHVTIHPGFSCGHRTAARVAGILAYVVGDEFRVDGLSFWPDADEPAVVKLDVDADLSVYQQAIESHISESDGSIDREPVPPHITLFKARDAGEDGDGRIETAFDSDRLRWMRGEYGDWSVEAGGYTVERRG